MARFRSPHGEVLDIPAKGVGAIRALGWVPVDKPAQRDESWLDYYDEAHVEIPEPKGNASREEWAAYAAQVGVEVPDGATRNEIRDAVKTRE